MLNVCKTIHMDRGMLPNLKLIIYNGFNVKKYSVAAYQDKKKLLHRSQGLLIFFALPSSAALASWMLSVSSLPSFLGYPFWVCCGFIHREFHVLISIVSTHLATEARVISFESRSRESFARERHTQSFLRGRRDEIFDTIQEAFLTKEFRFLDIKLRSYCPPPLYRDTSVRKVTIAWFHSILLLIFPLNETAISVLFIGISNIYAVTFLYIRYR